MIFKQWQQVLDGTKAQTRRLVKEGEFAVNQHGRGVPDPFWGDRIDAVYSLSGSLKWQVCHIYAVQPGRGKKAIGRIRITEIRRERLQNIAPLDCIAEGIRIIPNDWGTPWYSGLAGLHKSSIGAFRALWDSINMKKGTCWADNPEVWVLDFQLET